MIPNKYIGFGERLSKNNSPQFPNVINLSQNFYDRNVDVYHAGNIGNNNLAYSIEIPNVSQTGSFSNVRSVMKELKFPTFAKDYLFNSFQIIKINDFGKQSLTDGMFDFIVKLFINGKKVPQENLGLIRRYSSKEAFVLLERAVYPDSIFDNANICYIVEPITRGTNPLIGPLTRNSQTIKSWNITEVIYKLTSHIIYSDDDAENYAYKLSDLFFKVFNDDRFDILYNNIKINSRFFSSLFSVKFTDGLISMIKDSAITAENTRTILSSGQTNGGFDYYKFLYETLYDDNDAGYETNINNNLNTNVIAMLNTLGFTENEAKNIKLFDRSALPDYYIITSAGKKLSDFHANNIYDIELYRYESPKSGGYFDFAKRINIAPSMRGAGYSVDANGNINISNIEYKIEVIPKHNNKLHLFACTSSEITYNTLLSMLCDRGIYGVDATHGLDEIVSNSIEFYDGEGKLLNGNTIPSKFYMSDIEIPKNVNLGESRVSVSTTNLLFNDELYDCFSGIPNVALNNFPISIMQDPMLVYSGVEKKATISDSYVIYDGDLPINIGDDEIKYSDIVKNTQQEGYSELTNEINSIKSDIINNIFKNEKIEKIEKNITVLRNNLGEMATTPLQVQYSDRFEFNEEFVPAIIKINLSNNTGSNKYILITEYKCDFANNKIISTNYEYQKYDSIKQNIYVPVYTSQLGGLVNNYKVIIQYSIMSVTLDDDNNIISTAIETVSIQSAFII